MNSKNLKRGDVLLVHNKDHKHTAIYLGKNKVVAAHINEKGTTTGGQSGDQTGHEISIDTFNTSYPWECVMRYKDETIADGAALFAETIANDDSHGYDQIFRWNEKGDFDCSSLVIASYEAVNVPVKEKGGATWTGNMRSAFKKCGFDYVDPDGAEKPEEPKEEKPTEDKGNFYIVVSGDTLSQIAKKFGTSVSELVKINGIEDPDLIIVGQKIYLPNKVTIEDKPKKLTGVVNTKSLPLRVREKPNTDSKILKLLPKGSKVELISASGEWGQLVNRGYVFMQYIKLDT